VLTKTKTVRRSAWRFRQISLVALTALGACVTAREPLPQIAAWTAAGGAPPPSQQACPHVADVDLRRIARDISNPAEQAERERSRRSMQTLLDQIAISEGSPYRPGADAQIVLRSVTPPGGMYSNTMWSVVWRDAQGAWWFWRQNRDPGRTPPPPAPPPQGSPEHEVYLEQQRTGHWLRDDVRWPPQTGRLSPDLVATVERALSDPCRAWEPDIWPRAIPLRGRPLRPANPLPQDWTGTYVDLREGARVRQIGAADDRQSLQRVLVNVASSPRQ
jgi:hypothetical protein